MMLTAAPAPVKVVSFPKPPVRTAQPTREGRLGLHHLRLGVHEQLDQEIIEEIAAARCQPQATRPALPDPTAMCCAVVRATIEVLTGIRPAAHLARWVTPAVLDQITLRARIARDGHSPGQQAERGAPVLNAPVLIKRVRLDRTVDTAEATVIVEQARRVRGAAVRMEVRRGQWRVSVLEMA